MQKSNNSQIDNISETAEYKSGEKQRSKKQRQLARGEGLNRIKQNPANLVFIALLIAFFVTIRLVFGTLLSQPIQQIAESELFIVVYRIILSLFIEDIDSIVVETEPIINAVMLALDLAIAILFSMALWQRSLPWIGRPRIKRKVLKALEKKLATNLGLKPNSFNYYLRPFIISYTGSCNGSDVEEYIIWSGFSLDTWNKPEVKSEVLTTLGGVEAEEPKNRQSSSKRKRKDDRSIIIIRINPGAVSAKRDGLKDDEI